MFSVQLTHILIYFLLYKCITGEPTANVNPQQKQKWVKNRRTGGGAIIPCTWLLWVPREVEELVMEVIRARLPDVDGHEYMDVQVSKAGEKSWQQTHFDFHSTEAHESVFGYLGNRKV